MRNYAKVGGRKGMPGYRTPSVFKYKKSLEVHKVYKVEKSIKFGNKVLGVVSKIPKGKTMTYKQVAELSGSSRASRAVGNILNKNYDPNIPCHRVIRSDGQIGGYNRGAVEKRKRLEKEGVV